MILHLCDHFGREVPILRAVLDPFPGVPIFFVISGFLISTSWERYPLWKQYARNRILRIYPALWVAFALSVITVLAAGFVVDANPFRIVGWVLAQLTVGQFVTPSFFADFGTGILNGSLWTIPVELQFYVALPLLLIWRPLIWIGAALSILAASTLLEKSIALPGGMLMPIQATLLPNLYMFALGVLLARHFGKLRSIVVGQAHWWLLAYIVVAIVCARLGLTVGTNHPNPLVMALLAVVVISAAYSFPNLSGALLRGNDISYGIYIYHMVVANYLIEIGDENLWLAIGITMVLAAMSWWWVERPALALKKVSLHRVVAGKN